MTIRLQQIIQYLLKSTDLQTSAELATALQVSSKTIRIDLRELDNKLNDNIARIESYRGKGYRLNIIDKNGFKQFLQENMEGNYQVVPTEPQERVRFLMEKLLLHHSHITMDKLANELFISRSTLQSDLNSVRNVLQHYNLSLDHKPNYGIKVYGDEMQIRFCISEYIFNQNTKIMDQTSNWLELLSEDEIEWIRDSILSKLRKHKILITDISLHNLITHIAIACKRIQKENIIEFYQDELNKIMNKKEYTVAEEIVNEIGKKLQVTFSVNETTYLAVHLQGTKMLHSDSEMKEVNSVLNEDIQKLTQDILARIDQVYALDLSRDKELALALNLHLKPAINRYKYNMNLRNPMLDDIKTKYPLSFEAAFTGGNVVQEKLKIPINDDEIGYMALHIGLAMERQKKNTSDKKKCMIVCASGLGTAQLLLYKLSDHFGEQLNIIGTTEYYNLNQHPLKHLDFIISTIPIPEKLPVPVIQISTLLGSQDVVNIRNIIYNDIEIIEKYMRKQFTFLKQDFRTKREIIQFLGDELYKANMISANFIDSVLEREEYSTTSFGNLVAIPHPMEPQTDRTFWSIVTLNKPIQWGYKPVQFVCLLNISKQKVDDLKPMYDVLVKLLDNRKLIKKIIQCETYSELKSLLTKI